MRKDWVKTMYFIMTKERDQTRSDFLGFQEGSSSQAEVIMRETGAGDMVGKGEAGLGADVVSWLGGGPGSHLW